MITNERQHRITNSQVKRFQDAIAKAEQEGAPADTHPRLHRAMVDGMRSQLDELRQEVSDYEALRDGKVRKRVFNSLLELPRALIEGRIASRLTQKALGKKLGIPEQQIQRYEHTRYSGVGIERLQQVADALEIRLEKTVEYRVSESRSRPTRRRSTGARTGRKKQHHTTITEGSRNVATGRKTGKAASSAAGKTLSSKKASPAATRAAASDLAQVGNRKVTGKSAASSAGKTLASKSASKAAKKAAASDLSQASKKKR